MIVHPLESAGGRRHSPLSALPSIALHGALIFGAVRLTAHVALAHEAPIHPTRIVYVAPARIGEAHVGLQVCAIGDDAPVGDLPDELLERVGEQWPE